MNHSKLALLCFALIIIFSFFKKRERKKELSLDHKVTDQLKGISIILVILGHLCANNFIEIPSLKFSGAQGVSIFLLLSGFGLTKSYLNKGLDGQFFSKRFKTVLLPYMLVTISIILLDYILQKNTIPKPVILSSLFGLNMMVDPTMWYISFIFLWYLAFFIIFSLKLKNLTKLMMLVVFSCIIKFNIPSNSSLLNAPYEYSLHAFTFPIGVTMALYSQLFLSFVRDKKTQLLYLITIALFMVVGFISTFKLITFEHQTVYNLINLLIAIPFVIFIIVLSFIGRESDFLAFLGKYSFELYLLEAVFFTRYDILHKYPNKWFSLMMYITLLLLFSFIYNKLTKLLLILLDRFKNNQQFNIGTKSPPTAK